MFTTGSYLKTARPGRLSFSCTYCAFAFVFLQKFDTAAMPNERYCYYTGTEQVGKGISSKSLKFYSLPQNFGKGCP